MANLKTKLADVLLRPRVTEKASLLLNQNVYVFEVDGAAGKEEVAKAVHAFYNVTPLKVRMVKTPEKKISFRGRPGAKSSFKKAYVYLKKGDTINLS